MDVMSRIRRVKKMPVIVCMCVIMLLATVLPIIPAKADTERFTAEITIGFDGKAEINKYVPFGVTIENNDSDFSGRLQLIVANKANYNLMYETDISLAKGEKKTVNFACKVADNLGKVSVRMVNNKGKVVWKTMKRYTVDKTASQKIDIGILSDDFSALGYMDNIEFYDRETFKTNLVELTADNFPEDVNGLDMLEMIIISNFSTDVLTDEQIEALNLWINRGGMLVIGTGSNSSKTLSKINGHVLDVKPGKLQKYYTSFGLNYYGGTNYTSGNNGNNASDPYSDDEYVEMFEEWYRTDRDAVDDTCKEDFMYNYGLTDSDLEDDGSIPSYLEQDYYDYCFRTIYELYWDTSSWDTQNNGFYYPTVAADVLEFESDNDKRADREYNGDCETGQYDLARVYRVAEGYIALFGIDFTMNPIPNYEYSSEIMVYLISDYVLKGVIEAYEDISDTGYYSFNIGNAGNINYITNNFVEKISAAPLPPMALYILPIMAYLVSILVLYLVNRKKKKTFRLWYWYPVVALGMAVVIYCIGFSTRIIKPRVNTMSILKLNKPAAQEMNYVAVTTPSNKTCEVSFSDEYDIQLIRNINGYSYDQSDKVDMDTYRVAFRKGIDKMSVRFAGNIALSSDQFLLESIYPASRSFDVQYIVNVPSGATPAEQMIVKNNTGVDLEDVAVLQFSGNTGYSYSDMYAYSLGDIKNGASVDLSGINWNAGANKASYSYAETILSDKEKNSKVLGFFFGSLSNSYMQYRNRNTLAEYICNACENELRDDYDEHKPDAIYVIGFPKGSICRDVQFDNKYRTERTEIVIEKIYLSDMQTVEKH